MLHLNERDHRILDRFLHTVLESYKRGELELYEACADLAEAFALAANDNGNVIAYMQSKIEDRNANRP